MRRRYIFGVPIVVFFLAMGMILEAGSQEKEKEKKKVIQTTVDERGFQRDLTEVDLMYQTAKQYISAGLFDKAVEELRKVVTADSTRVEAWQDLADTYSKIKAYDKAADALGHALNQRPDDPYILSGLGYAQVKAKQLDKAVATYGRMLALDSLSYDANVHLAFISQLEGDKIAAIKYYRNALRGKGDDIQTMGALAKLYTDLGRKQDAVAMYERAVSVAPDNVVLKRHLGAAYISAQNFTKAAEVFEDLVQANPDNAVDQINLGISYSQIKKPKEAIAAMEKAIELKPDAGVAYQYLANLYNDTKQYAKAIAAAKKGLEVSPKKAALYCAWGKSLEKLKRFDEAIAKFKKAVDDPQWGGYAKKQIERQKKLKIREQKIKERSLE
jgi:tetratricopeptide (TPR) repeat protein